MSAFGNDDKMLVSNFWRFELIVNNIQTDQLSLPPFGLWFVSLHSEPLLFLQPWIASFEACYNPWPGIPHFPQWISCWGGESVAPNFQAGTLTLRPHRSSSAAAIDQLFFSFFWGLVCHILTCHSEASSTRWCSNNLFLCFWTCDWGRFSWGWWSRLWGIIRVLLILLKHEN